MVIKRKFFTNRDIAQLLRNIAAVYEIKGDNRFKVNAYHRAADGIEHATSETKDLWEEEKLDQIPGVGKNIAHHLSELFKTGQVKHFKKLMVGLPPAMFVFLTIPGIGSKIAYKLAKNLKIIEAQNAINRLKKAAQEKKISQIPGFKLQSEQRILKSIASLKNFNSEKKRMLLPYASKLAQEVIDYLKKSSAVLTVNPLGSLRRQVATIGDIDLAVKTKKPHQVIKFFTKFPKIKRILGAGKSSLGRVILDNNRQIDLRTQNPHAYGAMLQYFTGSKHHNIALRELALKKGLSLSEYGIKKLQSASWRTKTPKLKGFANEKGFYHYLGMDWIPPELREDSGEIEAAQKHQLPHLIQKSDIRGDLHLHSNFNIEPSHDLGKDSIAAMVQKAISLGYQYLAFSEHNPSLSRHTNKEIIGLLQRKKELIDKLNYSIKKTNKKE